MLRTRCTPTINSAFKDEEYRRHLLLELIGLIDHKRQNTRLYRRALRMLKKANGTRLPMF